MFFKGRKSSIGLNFSTNDLKALSTPQNGANNSVISGITNIFSFDNIDPNDPLAKNNTQSQSSKYFP